MGAKPTDVHLYNNPPREDVHEAGEPREQQEHVRVDVDSCGGNADTSQAEVAQAQHQSTQGQHLPPGTSR